MQLVANDLAPHLKKQGLSPIYWISGDDALLRQEASDVIRMHAKKEGYTREILTLTPQFKWDEFTSSIDHVDFFSEKQLIELHSPSGKFDTRAQAAIAYYLERKPEDKRLVIISHKLTSSQKKSKWVQSVSKAGAFVALWPPSRLALPKWLEQRLKQKGLRADRFATALLAQYSEGDLTTAKQAIEKLVLLQPDLPINLETMRGVISDHANYSAFDCVDAALAGQPKRMLRIIQGLKETAAEPTFVLWAITQQLTLLYRMQEQLGQGQAMVQVLKGQWERRQPLLKSALARLPLATLGNALEAAFHVDLCIKGVESHDTWSGLQQLYLTLSGV